MADYGFGDPYAAQATNPYLQMPQQEAPDWRMVLANLATGIGTGISQGAASGQGWAAGLAPGIMMGNQLTGLQQQQAAQRQMQMLQYQSMAEHRRLQEQNIRSQMAERELGMGIDRGIIGQLNGGGGQTASVPGLSVPSAPPRLGPNFQNEGKAKVDYLVNTHGFTPPQAAAVVGNLYQESGFNPTAVGDNGTAYGQAQWRGDRQTGLINFAKAQGKPPADPNVQLDYLVTEMKSGDMGAQRAYALLQQAKTPEEANAAMMHFFRPAGYTPANPTAGHGYQQRVQYTTALLPNGQPVAQGEGGPPGSPAGPSGTMVPQQALNAPPGASAGIDPLSQQMLLSKRFGPLGQARITNQNQQFTQELERQKFLDEQRKHAERETRERANSKVDPTTMRPNATLIETEAQIAAAAAKAKADAELESQGATKLVEKAVTEFVDKERPKGLAIQETIPNIHNVRRLVEAGAITGSGTETRNALAQLASTLGFKSNEAALTPAYLGALADQIVANAKALGVNPTNRDNEIIAKAKGADPNVSKEGVLQLLDVQEQLARKAHERYTNEAKRVMGLRSVKQAYGEDYFMLPEPQKYEEWLKENPLPSPPMSSPAASALPAGAQPAPVTPAASIPRAAIKHLMMNPKLVDEFELKYGPGTADAILRGAK